MSNYPDNKPIIGFTCGDINGVGPELIVKTLSDHRILEFCTPVLFGTNKLFNFYRKNLGDINFSYSAIKDSTRVNPKQVNLFNVWDEEVAITPGELNETGGKYAVLSLQMGANALRDGKIDGLVTAPIHKNNVQGENFSYTGHTPYLKSLFEAKDVLMLMVAENMRVALVTEHIPVKDLAGHITKEAILQKLDLLYASLQNDFGINKPRIAVLALNPHAGDDGLIGKEEAEIIEPAIVQARKSGKLVFGPYPADAFFARGNYAKFDAVLAMYHDQGLIPFKSLATGEGVNYTAGLSGVRTSPDHGTAFDIAGRGVADESSFRQAVFTCVDIIQMRREMAEQKANPLRKVSASVLRNAVDEKLEE